MIIGNPSSFAIESQILHAYERLSFRALGCFLIHIGNIRYGVACSSATLLANSFDQVRSRIDRRASHIAPFAAQADAGKLADAILHCCYAPHEETALFMNMPDFEFCNVLYSNELIWAPDGDEAFDDGSHILQFDVENRVRLIGFKTRRANCYDPITLSDCWMDADLFYGLLQRWYEQFYGEWITMPKTPLE